jgi:hypothetical protein
MEDLNCRGAAKSGSNFVVGIMAGAAIAAGFETGAD